MLRPSQVRDGIVALTFAAGAAGTGIAQDVASLPVPDRIHHEAFANSGLDATLRWLCDDVGPRLTGSPALDRAVTGCVERFEARGCVVAREPWAIASRWRRLGSARARLVSPLPERALSVAAVGWSPGTDGVVRGRVRAATTAPSRDGAVEIALHATWPAQDDDGAALALVDAGRPYGLLPMARIGTGFAPTRVPTAVLAAHDAALLRRLLAAGDDAPVVLEVEFATAVESGPHDVHNVVAELPADGPRRNEIVFLAASLDSWDLGSGATDDAAGAAVVLEVARILGALGRRPARTIRLLLLVGSEQGHAGAAAYVERHADELARHRFGIVLDGGTGAVVGVGLEGQAAFLEPVERWFGDARDLGFMDASLRELSTTDHSVLLRAGVPAFGAVRQVGEDLLVRDTQADTFDALVDLDLQQAAYVLASGLWAAANDAADVPALKRRD